MASPTARGEWAAMWPLVLAASLGITGSGIFAYTSGIFMDDVITEYGWTRTQYSSSFALMMGMGFFIMPVIGWLTDRFGPRRLVMLGMIPFAISLSLLGLANGSIWQWWLLCALISMAQGPIAQTVWVTAVIGRFHAARGLALALTLAGLSLGILIWPPLAAFFISTLGWRLAFGALALTWLIVAFPLAAAYFFGANDQKDAPKPKAPRWSYISHLKSPTFIGLLIAGGFFSSAYYGILIHLAPMLRGTGLSLGVAASIAGLAGLFSVIGRIAGGYLLDHFSTRVISVTAFLLPAAASLLLLSGQGSIPVAILSVILLGLASGAEMDIITFIAARRFGKEAFASVYSVFMAVISALASTGPLIAGALFDVSQSYSLFLMVVMGMVGIGALIMAIIPISPTSDPGSGEAAHG